MRQRAANQTVAYHRAMNITISDWAIIVATVVGPLAAVLISLWIEHRRAQRATRQGLVHTFLNAMNHPGDANYQMAVRVVAVEFRKDAQVMGAHRDFLDAANLPNGPAGLTAAEAGQTRRASVRPHRLQSE